MNRQALEKATANKGLPTGTSHLVALAVFWLTWPAQGAAETTSTQAQVNVAIQQYVNDLHGKRFARVESDIQQIDSRMQLPLCDQPLKVEHRPADRMAGRLTFKTSCEGSTRWSTHVAGSIRTFDQVVVAAAGIPNGTHLSSKDLALQEQDVSVQHRGYFQAREELIGFMTKRTISAGQIITPLQVDPARLVSKGENVAIMAEGSGILIRTSGVALMDGALGDLIQVRNTKSNTIVEGRIVAPGQIKVSL
jgi:flagella basal body P-ring formation protein FlgA